MATQSRWQLLISVVVMRRGALNKVKRMREGKAAGGGARGAGKARGKVGRWILADTRSPLPISLTVCLTRPGKHTHFKISEYVHTYFLKNYSIPVAIFICITCVCLYIIYKADI